MAEATSEHLYVTYMELREAPCSVPPPRAGERIGLETLTPATYLELYRRVGSPLRWDQRLLMPAVRLEALLAESTLHLYVLRDLAGDPVGFCEFDRSAFPEIELKHFGLVPEAQGRGIGLGLLCTALGQEWDSGAERIWLHTDTWDHPAAVPVYKRAGFKMYEIRYEPAASL